MQFPFTFSLSVPGLHNPFLAKPGPARTPEPRIEDGSKSLRVASLPPTKFPPANLLSLPVPLARKRGWIPANPELSHAAASAASTSGYLDTPAKYRDMPLRDPQQEAVEMIAELPPAKRRRTFAGSIVSTALSAALIGTAVGLTVYRLWRDRSKQSDQLPPPPPYQRGDWVPGVPEPLKQIEAASSLKSRKPRPAPSSVRRSVGRPHRKSRAKLQTATPPRSVSPAYTSSQSEHDYVHVHHHSDDAEPELEPEMDQMDWIGDRLTHLIQEGQRALGCEIVVMSDAKEDEVDDGSDAWVEDSQSTPSAAGPSMSRHGSVRSSRRTHRPRDIPIPSSTTPYPISPPGSASPRKRQFDLDAGCHSPGPLTHGRLTVPSSPHRMARGTSVESETLGSIVSSFREDKSAWESPELRESMERARARYTQRLVQ